MTDWSKPALTDAYASVLTELMGRDADAATQFVGTSSTNIPNGAIRWNPATYRWETYSSSGGTWSAWSTQLNIGTLLLGANSATGTMQAVPRSQADSLYQAAGSYADLGGLATQVFLVANSGAGTQQAVPRAQADGMYQAAGSYAALGGLGTQVFLVANSAAGTQQAVPRAQADGLYASISLTGVAMVANANTWAKSQSATVQAAAYAATITLDLTQGNDAAVTLTGNATLANPAAMTAGTSGHIAITQDATGGRTMAYGSYWKFGTNGAPTLSTAANAEDVLVYWVRDASHIIASIVQGVQ